MKIPCCTHHGKNGIFVNWEVICIMGYRNESENGDLSADLMDELRKIIDRHRGDRSALIQVLQEAQILYGYLPLEVQKEVALGLGVPVAEVYGVVTFYSFFSLHPKGRNKVSICLGTACYVRGANLVLERFEKELGIRSGECTPDRKFSIDACRCIGACGLAPVIMINEDVYGRVTPDEIPGILAKYKEG